MNFYIHRKNDCVLIDACRQRDVQRSDVYHKLEKFLCDYVNDGGRYAILLEIFGGEEGKIVDIINTMRESDLYYKVIMYVIEHCVSNIGDDDDAIVMEYITMLRRIAKTVGIVMPSI